MIGLSITKLSGDKKIAGKKGTMIRWCQGDSLFVRIDEQGLEVHEVVMCFFESRAAFLAGDLPLVVVNETKRIEIAVPVDTELTQDIVLQYIKTPLAKIYALADEK